MNTISISLKALPYVPLDPQWLVESAAFHSPKADVVRAIVNMLSYAWRATPAGTIPADFEGIARISGLDAIAVGEHYDALTAGWELRGDRLHHVQMCELAARIAAVHGETLERWGDQAAVVMQSPEDFMLTCQGPEETSARTKGRHLLPPTFTLTDTRRAWMANSAVKIVDPADQDFVFEKFRSGALRDNSKFNNWDMAFENYVLKENLRNLPSRQGLVPLVTPGVSGRVGRFGSRGAVAENHNVSVMETVRARANG